MGEIMHVDGKKKSSMLLDECERLSIEIQLNQAMLRRSLSEPGSSFLLVGPTAPAPQRSHSQLLRQPVEQGKRGSPWPWGLTKIVKKLIRPIVYRRRKGNKGGAHQDEPNCKDLGSWRRFSKSLRL